MKQRCAGSTLNEKEVGDASTAGRCGPKQSGARCQSREAPASCSRRLRAGSGLAVAIRNSGRTNVGPRDPEAGLLEPPRLADQSEEGGLEGRADSFSSGLGTQWIAS